MDWLLDQIVSRVVTTGSLTIVSASGRTHTFGDGTGRPIAIRFTSSKWQFAVCVDPEMRLGEAYMEGGVVMERGTLAEFLDLTIRNIASKPTSFPARVTRGMRSLMRRVFAGNTHARASHNAKHHYNIDERLYRLFLDEDMQYSCAYFTDPDDTIEQAQLAKRQHITGKLNLDRSGLKVLDIGSGWGGLGLHIAQSTGASVTGINLSDEQVRVANERARARPNLSCNFRIQDFRDVRETFDRIVSVGMFEHVGTQYYDEFFRKCYQTLDDDGVMLLHTVGRWDGPSDTNAWVWHYIFPGGYTPALSELTPAIERSGFIIADIEVWRLHYAETLRCWRERFLSRRDEVLKLFDERFIRMWEFYLAGFEASFRHYGLVVFQVQLIKRLDAVPLTRNYMYRPVDSDTPVSQAAE